MFRLEFAGALITNGPSEVLLARRRQNAARVLLEVPHRAMLGKGMEAEEAARALMAGKYDVHVSPHRVVATWERKEMGIVAITHLVACELDDPTEVPEREGLEFRNLTCQQVIGGDESLEPLAEHVRWLLKNEELRV